MLSVYRALARRQQHLLSSLLQGDVPVQWQHYPDDDAHDARGRWQWYYHSHSPQDRPGASEHGHFHLFARVGPRGIAGVDVKHEAAFLDRVGADTQTSPTRHLLAVALDARGVPTDLFCVNAWVTGDLPLSAAGTVSLLAKFRPHTGNAHIDRMLAALITLYLPKMKALLAKRDRQLLARARCGAGTLEDRRLEILATLPINLDKQIAIAAG